MLRNTRILCSVCVASLVVCGASSDVYILIRCMCVNAAWRDVSRRVCRYRIRCIVPYVCRQCGQWRGGMPSLSPCGRSSAVRGWWRNVCADLCGCCCNSLFLSVADSLFTAPPSVFRKLRVTSLKVRKKQSQNIVLYRIFFLILQNRNYKIHII